MFFVFWPKLCVLVLLCALCAGLPSALPDRCPVLPYIEFWPFWGPLPGHFQNVSNPYPPSLPKKHLNTLNGKNHFHQKKSFITKSTFPLSSQIPPKGQDKKLGCQKQNSPYFCENVAGQRPDAFTETWLMPTFFFSDDEICTIAECGRHHLVGCGWIIPNPPDSSTLQERHSNCLCRATSEKATPPAVPGGPDALSQDPRFRTGTSRGLDSRSPQTTDHLPRSPPPARDRSCLELGISPLFVSACFSQGDAVCFVRVPAVNPVPVQSCHQRGVEGQLAAPEKRQPFRHNFEPSAIRGDVREVLHENVRGDPCSTLPTDLSNSILHCKSPAAQDPDSRTRCSVVAKKGQGCGHKSNGGQKEAKACGDGRRTPGMVPSPSRRGERAMLSTARKRADHSVTRLVPVRWVQTGPQNCPRDSAHGPMWMPLFATHAGALSGLVRVATCGLVVPPLTVRSKRESPFQPFRVLRWCEQPSPCTLPTSG